MTREEIMKTLDSDTLPALEDMLYEIKDNDYIEILPTFIDRYNLKDDLVNQYEFIWALMQLDLEEDDMRWPSESKVYSDPIWKSITFSDSVQFDAIKNILTELKNWKDINESEYLDRTEGLIVYMDEICNFVPLPLIGGWVKAMDPESDILSEATKLPVINTMGQFKDKYMTFLRSIGLGSEAPVNNAQTSDSNLDTMNNENASNADLVDEFK